MGPSAGIHEGPVAGREAAILIVGGFLTGPFNYWPLRRRLRAHGHRHVAIAPIWPWDWLLAAFVGLGPLLGRTGESIAREYRRAGHRPIIVVGHSGGGILARLAMAPEPFGARVAGVDRAVGALVTLGTPHGLSRMRRRVGHAGHRATRFLDRVSPGAAFAPTTGYVTVGSRAIVPRRALPGSVAGRPIRFALGLIMGEVAEQPLDAPGDGLVPLDASHLAGARQLTFNDVLHGCIGGPWYGDEEMVARWLPHAREVWERAMRARVGDAG